MPGLDLTPFGYTPTEALVYQALLDLGPSSGYAVAKHVSIARANAYQALNGLAAKGGAALIADDPQRFRAVQPQALFSRIADAEARKLDRLEHQLRPQGAGGAAAVVPLQGLRSIREVATRTIVRAEGLVQCLAPGAFIETLVPALRKREADGTPAQIWTVGPAEGATVTIRGELTADTVPGLSAPAVLVSAADSGLAADLEAEPRGYWTSDPLLLGLIGATIAHRTA